MRTKFIYLLCLVSGFFGSTGSYGQISVVSSNGYTVNIVVQPKQVVVSSGSSCTWGYNYNLQVSYTVTFSGSNIPSSLYTLQGSIGCGSSSHYFGLPTTGSGSSGTLTTGSNVWRSNTDCATATVSSLSCNQAQITISGPGINNQTLPFLVQQGAPLPVQLASFDAVQENDRIKLQWLTSSELNSNYFEVQRSTNNTTWTVIKTIKAAGNSSLPVSYESYDDHPVTGSSWYRLKETDYDGKSIYSETKQVSYQQTGPFSVYPNPNKGNTISIKGITNPSDYILTLYTAAGTGVYKAKLTNTTFDTPHLSPGLYMINLLHQTTGESINLRYIKL